MPKVGVSEIRRKQLIDATFTVLHTEGYSHTTSAKISSQAGLSTSIINHYFASKDALIEAAFRDLAATLLREVTTRRSAAESPIGKVLAIVDGNFAPSQCTPQAVSAWLFFWSQVPYRPEFARIHQICDRRQISYLRRSLEEMLPDQHLAEDISHTIKSLTYGFWLEFAHYPDEFKADRARQLVLDAIVASIQGSWSKFSSFKLRQQVVSDAVE